MRPVVILGALLGGVEALLLARLLARLLAARPDHPVFVALYALTGPLVAPLAWLDVGQPRFGAALEWSTLVLCALLPLCLLLVAVLARRAPPQPYTGSPSA